MPGRIKAGGAWKNVATGHIKKTGEWKPVVSGWKKVSGNWEKIYSSITETPFILTLKDWSLGLATDQTIIEYDFKATLETDLSNLLQRVLSVGGNETVMKSFNLDTSQWDVSEITNMDAMFKDITGFVGNGVPCWNLASLTSANEMFMNATAFNKDLSAVCFAGLGGVAPTDFATGSAIAGLPDFTHTSCAFGPQLKVANPADVIAILDVTDKSTMFQDIAGTIPVTQHGDDVQYILDKSGNGNHCTIPIRSNYRAKYYEASNGKGYLEYRYVKFEFVNDLPATYDITAMIPGVGKYTKTSNAGRTWYWGETSIVEASTGPMVFTTAGTGNTVSGFECFGYPAGTTRKIDGALMRASSVTTDFASWNMEGVTQAQYLLAYNTTFNDPGIQDLDTSTLQDFDYMFRDCTAFNQDISGWVVDSMTSAQYMFDGCENFNQDISTWDVSGSRYLNGMFTDCKKFNQPVQNWTLRTGVSISSMFQGCSVFNQDMTPWTLTGVTNTYNLFADCTVFNNGDAPGVYTKPMSHFDMSNVTSISGMFRGCKEFNQDITMWNLEKVTQSGQTFWRAGVFDQNLNTWNLDKSTRMDNMFASTENYNNGGQPLTWNFTSLKNANGMFSFTKAFNQPIPNFKMVASSSIYEPKCEQMFQAAEVFNQDTNSWDMSLVVRANGMFQRALSFNNGEAVGASTNPMTMFDGNTGDRPLNRIDSLFNGAPAFNQPINNWDVSSVTNLQSVFAQASSGERPIFNQPLNDWVLTSCTSLNDTFRQNDTFNQPLNNWDTSLVTNFSGTFDGCDAFDQDISMWNVSASTNSTNFDTFSPIEGTAKSPFT